MMTSPTILVIEDEHDMRVLLRDTLERAGYVVVTACNGIEGLNLLEHMTRPALILLDLTMPLMGGRDFLRSMRAKPNSGDIPVVIVSTPERTAELAGEGGYVGCLYKPFVTTQLVATVRECQRPATQVAGG